MLEDDFARLNEIGDWQLQGGIGRDRHIRADVLWKEEVEGATHDWIAWASGETAAGVVTELLTNYDSGRVSAFSAATEDEHRDLVVAWKDKHGIED